MTLRIFAAGLIALVPASASLAAEVRLLEGAPFRSERGSSLVFDQAETCRLNAEKLTVSEENYRVLPTSDDEKAALEEKVARLSAAAGFGSDPLSQQVSREFILNILISRVILRLKYTADDGDEGMSCLTGWLMSEGFEPITEAEAQAISDARNDD